MLYHQAMVDFQYFELFPFCRVEEICRNQEVAFATVFARLQLYLQLFYVF